MDEYSRCYAFLFSPLDTLLRSVDGAQELEYAGDVDYYFPDGGPYQQDGAYYDVDFSDVQE